MEVHLNQDLFDVSKKSLQPIIQAVKAGIPSDEIVTKFAGVYKRAMRGRLLTAQAIDDYRERTANPPAIIEAPNLPDIKIPGIRKTIEQIDQEGGRLDDAELADGVIGTLIGATSELQKLARIQGGVNSLDRSMIFARLGQTAASIIKAIQDKRTFTGGAYSELDLEEVFKIVLSRVYNVISSTVDEKTKDLIFQKLRVELEGWEKEFRDRRCIKTVQVDNGKSG